MNILEDHRLAPYSTFQIGGLADFFLEAKSTEEVLAGIAWAEDRDMPYFVFGGGSNILFDDGGFRGLVIRVKSGELAVEGERVTADAGVMTAKVVQAAAEAGLSGLEAWNGLPGTVGGAVYGNAGCFGVETKDILESAEVFFPGEGVKKVKADFFEYDYRDSALKAAPSRGERRRVPTAECLRPGVVLVATFKLKKGEVAAIKTRMMEIAKSRIQKQPAGSSTGSFFKNPSPEKPAGWLLDQCGLKGKRVGKAQISDQHANFFLNTGGASSSDILALQELATQAVQDKFGITLEREVIFVLAG